MIRRMYRRSGRKGFGRKRDNIWLAAFLPTGVPAAGIEFSQLTDPFLNMGSAYSMVDPTLVRTHLHIGAVSDVGANLAGAWGLIKLPIGTSGGVPSDIVPSPLANATEDWIGHGYFTVPSGAAFRNVVAMGLGSSGSWADIRAKRKMGETDTIVLVFDWGTAAGYTGSLPIARSAGARMLFNGPRR